MREDDIRPADLLNEYLRLSSRDAETYFPDRERLSGRPCPACGGRDAVDAFEKDGFPVARCAACRTLYVTAVPAKEALDAYYRGSPSQKYWANVFTPAVAETRRRKIVRPRVERIKALLADLGRDPAEVLDVGAGQGMFLEECRATGLGRRHRAVEPAADSAAAAAKKGFDVFTGFAREAAGDDAWRGRADLVTAFEVIEHVTDPVTFVGELAALAAPGGHILMTGLCGTGFDILVLRQHSRAIAPPHHLTFLSHAGVGRLLRGAGLEEVSFFTPGLLDVDIVANAYAADPAAVGDGFARHLVSAASDGERQAFQRFLAENGLSTHMWIVARRPA